MRINSIFTSPISNNKGQSKDTSFGYGISIARKDFKNVRKTLKNRVKIRQLNEIEQFVIDKQLKLREVIDNVQRETGAKFGYFSTIGLKFKIAKGGIPQVLVGIKGSACLSDTPFIPVSNWISKDGQINIKNEEQLIKAVELKAKEAAKIALDVEKQWGSSAANGSCSKDIVLVERKISLEEPT